MKRIFYVLPVNSGSAMMITYDRDDDSDDKAKTAYNTAYVADGTNGIKRLEKMAVDMAEVCGGEALSAFSEIGDVLNVFRKLWPEEEK